MEQGLVTDIAICIIAAWVVAVVSQVARQPLLLAYLVAGFAIGPHGFKWITNTQNIQTISEIGLSLLLFMIGLEIDLKKMLSAGRVITLTAAAQILGCVLLGWLVFDLDRPGAKPAGGALPRRGGGDEQHGHHRQNPLRQTRTGNARRPRHARRAGVAGHRVDPVSRRPAEPEKSRRRSAGAWPSAM